MRGVDAARAWQHSRMVLKLDPRYPLVWRSPSSLQVGIASPRVVLHDVSVATERMIAALTVGVSDSGLAMIGRSAGADPAAIDTLVRQLEPALEHPEYRPQTTVVVVGSGETAERITAGLATAGVQVRTAKSAAAARLETVDCDLAVIVAHYVVEPELHGVWLRRDIPHLPVVFSDTAVTVGPLVEPGAGPCLYCLERHRIDADAAWPAIATQLLGRRSALDGALLAGEVAGITCRRALARLLGVRDDGVASTLQYGEITSREWMPHPECGCLALV